MFSLCLEAAGKQPQRLVRMHWRLCGCSWRNPRRSSVWWIWCASACGTSCSSTSLMAKVVLSIVDITRLENIFNPVQNFDAVGVLHTARLVQEARGNNDGVTKTYNPNSCGVTAARLPSLLVPLQKPVYYMYYHSYYFLFQLIYYKYFCPRNTIIEI